ncbi:uncharacterized protein [Diadema setosum]|uniref:uncharacterized protein n=1 Tax=Diadema setosum TaxID=31175 RepID=UPI003B3A11C6
MARDVFGRDALMPPFPARQTIFDSAQQMDCYHGKLTNSEEDKIFKYYLDTRGAYLLRKSNSQPDVLVISIVVDRKNIYHIKVHQRHGNVCIIQSTEEFSSLAELLQHFSRCPFPAVKHKNLYLTRAIPSGSGGGSSSSRAKQALPPMPGGRPPRLSPEQKKPSIDERPPMPLPSVHDPIYAETRHLYSRVDKVESDQLDLILRLCAEVDKETCQLSRMKCSCGLYMEESTLIGSWMMHRDTEGESTKGRVFFLDTKTNRSMWRLPSQVEQELKTLYPEKWKRVEKLMKEPVANYDF